MLPRAAVENACGQSRLFSKRCGALPLRRVFADGPFFLPPLLFAGADGLCRPSRRLSDGVLPFCRGHAARLFRLRFLFGQRKTDKKDKKTAAFSIRNKTEFPPRNARKFSLERNIRMDRHIVRTVNYTKYGTKCQTFCQPCLCLCDLFLEQMTMTLPFLLMTLHLSHMGLTEGLTFIFFLLA